MTTAISPNALITLLTSGALLPVGAFLAALPAQKGKKRTINIVGVVIGVTALTVVSMVLYHYS